MTELTNLDTGIDQDGTKVRDTSYTQNRELSWLEFNRRVLQEGCDPRVPILERLKFISIFTSNLDEFFRVRVGSLDNLTTVKKDVIDNKTGWTAMKQLDKIFGLMPDMYLERDQAFEKVNEALQKLSIRMMSYGELTKKEQTYLEEHYERSLLPVLSPLVVDSRHPFPHLVNEQLYAFADIEDEKGNPYYGLVGMPTALKPVLFFPESAHYILMEEVLRNKIGELFEGFTVKSTAIISITRNADINLDEDIDDEMEENIRTIIKKTLRKRNRLAAVRLEIQGKLPEESVEFLRKHHELRKNQVYFSNSPLRMKYVFMIEDALEPSLKNKVTYRPFEPQLSPLFTPNRSAIDQVFEADKLLHYPFERMEPFLQLLKEAAYDPRVVSIKITIYRMASVSKVAEYLAQAAENGKEVLALMELRARFDEENNIDYSERLEEAGCTIIYGFENYKVHSKICLITAYHEGQVRTITQIGTGNYNEKTAKQYTDLAFITASDYIGRDATSFFKNMLISNLDGKYDHLLVAPTGIKPGLMKLFDREIERAKNGEDAQVIIKCNSISERDLIDKMMEASCSGVKITLIVRGICCIRPGVPNRTENIRVISIVGRFLEHHRIYAFGAEKEDLYISSADLMTRNIVNRVEIAVPIRDPEIRKRLISIINIFLNDTEKAKELQVDGSYKALTGQGLDSQNTFINLAEQSARKMQYNTELSNKIDLRNAVRMGDSDSPVAGELSLEESMDVIASSPMENPAATADKNLLKADGLTEEKTEKVLSESTQDSSETARGSAKTAENAETTGSVIAGEKEQTAENQPKLSLFQRILRFFRGK